MSVLSPLTDRVNRGVVLARRATLPPLLVRAAIYFCGLLALVVAFPAGLVASQVIVAFVVAAAIPAFAPRSRAATLLALLVVGGWVLDTTYYAEPVALWRVLTLATTLYLGHTLTALAAVLPPDATVDLTVITRWMTWAFGVVLASAVLTIVMLSLTADLAGSTFVLATLAGLAAAVGATALLSRLLGRP
jgi:hypothetical protein